MNLRRTWAMARKEGLHVVRDPRSLALAIAIPVLMLVLFGYALTLDVDHVPAAVWDRDGTPESREFLGRFGGSRYFDLRRHASSYAEIERSLDAREARIAIVVPAGFACDLAAGRTARVQAIVDGSDPSVASLVLGYASVIGLGYSQDVALEGLRRRGLPGGAPPVDLRPRVWFNPELESRNAIVPGLIAVIMMVIAGLLASLTVSREWERGTMELLISTPVKGPELVLGKMAPYFAVGMLDVAIVVVLGGLLFGVPLRGNGALVFLTSGVFLAGALGMGMLVSVSTRNQLQANQIAMVATFRPAFLLSGFVFPVENMPIVIQAVTRLVPARYFVGLLRDIYLKGLGLGALALETGLLAAFAAAMIALAILRFRKRLE